MGGGVTPTRNRKRSGGWRRSRLEFIVTRAERGKGIGTALMTALLADRPERYATLCANPAAPARRIYQRWGWRSVATVHPPTMGAMDVLLFEFHPDRGPAPTAHP